MCCLLDLSRLHETDQPGSEGLSQDSSPGSYTGSPPLCFSYGETSLPLAVCRVEQQAAVVGGNSATVEVPPGEASSDCVQTQPPSFTPVMCLFK